MGNKVVRKGTKQYKELVEGMPESFYVTVNWDEASTKCDRDRRNCAIYHAIRGRRDVTYVSAGADEISFIWRGDARVAVKPTPGVAGVIARNDLASLGEIDWPTGSQSIRIDLKQPTVKDLRPARESRRKHRDGNRETVRKNGRESKRNISNLDYKARAAKRLETERLRGRFA